MNLKRVLCLTFGVYLIIGSILLGQKWLVHRNRIGRYLISARWAIEVEMFRDRFPIAGVNGGYYLIDKTNWVTVPHIEYSNRVDGLSTGTVSPYGILTFQFETNRLDGSVEIWISVSGYKTSAPIVINKDELNDFRLDRK